MSPSQNTPPPQQVAVNFTATGLGKLKTSWLDFAGNLMAPVAVLAAGGTKTQALWAGIKDVLLTKVLGPIGMVAGTATGFLFVTRNLIKEWRTMGLVSSKAIETLTLQFKPLLGSLELAKKRAREVFAFSVTSPFKFAELAVGNKILEALTRGALAGKAGMELVADAAAVAGAGFEETARSVGRLYDGIMSGRPVGEAGMRLQELGLITGETRNQIESMQASGAAGSAIWKVVEKDLQRAKGAARDLSESLEGLESTYEDTRTQLESGFGSGFLEGEKAAVKSATALLEAMVPAAQTLGGMVGTVSNAWEKFKGKIEAAVTGIPGFSALLSFAAVVVVGFAGAITLATGGLLARFAMGIFSAAAASKQLAASTGSAAAAQVAQTAVTGRLVVAKAALVAALNAAKASSYAQAAASLKTAAVETMAALRTNALAASQLILRGAFAVTRTAAVFLTGQIWSLTAAILASPALLFAGVLMAAGVAMLYFYNTSKKAREELEAYAAASRTIISNLEKEIRHSKTVADLRLAEAQALRELTQAHLDLKDAQAAGNGAQEAQAQRRIDAAKKLLDLARDPERKKGLDKDAVDVERANFLRDQQKAAKESAAEFESQKGPGAERERAAAKLKELQDLKKATEDALAAEKKVAEAREVIQRGTADQSVKEAVLLKNKEAIQKRLDSFAPTDDVVQFGSSYEQQEIDLMLMEKTVAKLAEIQTAKEQAAIAQSKLNLESGSELLVLKEKLALYDQLKTAADDVANAEAKKNEAGQGDDSEGKQKAMRDAQIALELAKKGKAAAEAAARAGGVGADFNSQDTQGAIARIEAERNKNLDPAAIEEARQRSVTAELGLVQSRIDAEAQVAALRLKGYEQEKALLGFELQKLEAKKNAGRIDAEEYQRQRALLAAQEAAMETSGREKREELQSAMELAALGRKEQEARRAGDTQKADALRAAADRVADERAKKDAEKSVEGMGGSAAERAAMVSSQVAEERAARESERAKAAAEQRLAKDRAKAEQASASAELKARVLRLQGKNSEAKALRESTARAQDEIIRREKQRAYRDQNFSGSEADAMANRDVRIGQAQRAMEELMGRKSSVVASSLAVVGGGGNVGGSDPSIRLQERIVKLLEAVEKNTGSIDTDGF